MFENSFYANEVAIRKILKNRITSENVIACLKSKGFMVVFYDKNGDILRQYGLEKHIAYANSVNAFTYICSERKFVFVSDSMSGENLLLVLLHELAHIEFGHLEKAKGLRELLKEEMEADAWAYGILNPPKKTGVLKNIAIGIIIFLVGMCAANIGSIKKISAQGRNESSIENVYVVQADMTYHQSKCQCLKENEFTVRSKKEAEKGYVPCTVCTP